MDGHNDLLGELAADAALERSDFLVQSTEQLRKFLDRHRERIAAIGGLTLIDEEPDYLSIAPDLTFRSRSRYLDETTGEWVSETEVIEHASELVELYNPADIYAAFAEAAREAAGLARRADRPRATSSRPPGSRPTRPSCSADGRGPVRRRGRLVGRRPDGPARCGRRRSGRAPAVRPGARVPGAEPAQRGRASSRSSRRAATGLSGVVGELIIVDDDDERLSLTTDRHVPRRGHPGGRRRRVADADQRRRARRVLRPDRRLRRPGRLARRGLPVGRPGTRRRRGRGRRLPARVDEAAAEAEDEPTA